MAEYHYLYIYSPSSSDAKSIQRAIIKRAQKKGVEVYGDDKLTSAPSDEVKRAIVEGEVSDPLHNWLLYIPPQNITDYADETIHGFTLRLQDQSVTVEILRNITIPEGVGVQVRQRLATHTNENPPFSYDPSQDFVTEPDTTPYDE